MAQAARPYGQDPNQPQVPRDQLAGQAQTGRAPTSAEVTFMHRNSDLDARPEAQHHTLGPGSSQAAPGNHNHRDGVSIPIMEGITLTGTKAGSNAVLLASIVAALKQLGATDATS